MFEALGFAVSRGNTCAMVPELKSRNALEDGNYSLRAAKIGLPRCSGTGVCSCVLPTPPTIQGKVASLAQVLCLFFVCLPPCPLPLLPACFPGSASAKLAVCAEENQASTTVASRFRIANPVLCRLCSMLHTVPAHGFDMGNDQRCEPCAVKQAAGCIRRPHLFFLRTDESIAAALKHILPGK